MSEGAVARTAAPPRARRLLKRRMTGVPKFRARMPDGWQAAHGRKGKGAGGGGIEAPNTLQSKSVVRILDLLSEGPIGGLVNGAQSIFFNGVPLMASNGSYNFKGVTWELRTGLPSQAPMPGFPASEDTFQFGVLILNSTPQIHETTNPDVTRVAVTIQIPALFTTDTNNGNINDSSVRVQIAVQQAGTPYSVVIDDVVSGKCTSTYERTYTFPLTAPCNIQISRLTADSNTVNVQNAFYLLTIDEIIDHAMIYPDSAYIGLTFDSELFGSTLPTRSYDLAAMLVSVPANYNALTRTYATTGPGTLNGTWDGASLQPAVTDNPCWIIYDLLSQGRYGFGLPSQVLEVTKFDMYQIGQYCDELIPDGFGGFTPRYTCNVCITTRDDAYNVLLAFTSIFRGMSWWGGGTVRFTADMPTPVTKIVNQADVLDGNFAYASTPLKARRSMAIASFIDPSNQFQPSPELYQYPKSATTANNGQNIASLVAFGATTRAQAHLAAHWLIDQEQTATETVTYRAGLDHLDLMPGQVIEVADPAYQGERWSGRVLSAVKNGNSTNIVVDAPIQNLIASEPSLYQVDLADPGYGIFANCPVQAITTDPATGNTLLEVLTADVCTPGTLWNLKSTTLVPREFRVISITEPQRGQLEITALFHDPSKYDRIELGIDLADQPFYSNLTDPYGDAINPPSNVTATDYYVGEGTTTVLRTTVSWTPSSDPRVLTYQVEVAGTPGYTNMLSGQAGPSCDIDNVPVGTYVFSVRGVTGDGRQSPWALSQQVLINGSPVTPPPPLGLTAVGGARMVSLSWIGVSAFNLYYYEVWRAPDSAGSPGTFTLLAQVSATSYTDAESTVLAPLSYWWYEVRAVTTTLTYGGFAGPVRAQTTQLLVNDLGNAIITTAQFAQGIAPVGLVNGVPETLIPGQPVVLNEVDGKLYRWNGTAYIASIVPLDIQGTLGLAQLPFIPTTQLSGQISAGQIQANCIGTELLEAQCIGTAQLQANSVTTGIVAAGAINTQQLAAGAVNAGILASTTLLTLQAQIGYAVVGTVQVINDSITSFASMTQNPQQVGNGGGAAQVLSFTATMPQARQGIIFVSGNQSVSGINNGGAADAAYTYAVDLNGNAIYNRTVSFYLDYVNLAIPVNFTQGTNTIQVSWNAVSNVTLLSVSATALGRIA